MSNTKILALFLIIASISKSLQLTINCDYNKSPSVTNGRLKYKLVKEPYSCVLSTLNIKSKLLVQSVTGKHLDKNKNDDVKALKIIGGGIISSTGKESSDNVLSVCEVIPAGIGSVFRNIEALTVWRSNLKTVSSRDLQQFANLREIWLFTNELEYLESKLFQYNPNVEVISFNANSIKFIGENFFSYLPKLQKAFFHYNPCVDEEAVDGTQLAAIKNTIKEKCAVKETAQPLHVTVDCKFEVSSVWKTVKDPYGCTLQKSNFDRKLFIGNVTGSHAKGRSISDVKALQIVGGVCQIIPGEFGSIFQNIEALSVKKASLKLVTGRDLQQFSNLREIWLEANDLNYLEGKLFEFNPNVELVVFKDNKIKFVGDNFFSYIPKLREADFSGNECFDDGKTAGLKLNAVQERVKEKCVVEEPTFIYTTIRPDGLTYWDSRKSEKDDGEGVGADFKVLNSLVG
ncbi:leucine-rich repeat-containing protein egg-6-like [Bradysia coprophila]|uniref:leucine-rich repeat-containing protein egg-6-like n=1 Tax=Bradysia coprophila TaxID=38358 RepID=UPI00187DCFCD|nr:leucine-rich repeat-containing protein egg-6-like [Bradysia coprophila]